DWKNWMVETVNGQPVRDFQQFVNLVHNAKGSHLILADDDGYQMVIDNAKARASEQQILSLYQIPSAHSVALFNEAPLPEPAIEEDSLPQVQPVKHNVPAKEAPSLTKG